MWENIITFFELLGWFALVCGALMAVGFLALFLCAVYDLSIAEKKRNELLDGEN